jgi:hypothetical protein
MKKVLILFLIVVYPHISNGQILNVNTFEDFVKIKDSMKSGFQELIIWGKFKSYGKSGFNPDPKMKIPTLYKQKCNTAIELTIFNDTLIYYVPIRNRLKFNKVNYKEDDIIKMRILLLKDNPYKKIKTFFIVSDLL